MDCNTCQNRNICKYSEEFNEIITKASNEVYSNIFDVTCNEYIESKEFKKYLGMTDEEIAQQLYDEIIKGENR